MDEIDKYPMYIETAPELDSNPGPLSYKAPALTTLLVVYFDQLLGAARTQKLVKQPFFVNL